jgi:uncharacterized protein (TIGR03435 family)
MPDVRLLPRATLFVIALALPLPATAPLRAQEKPPEPLPRFEAASLKPNVSGATGPTRMVTQPGGVFLAVNAPLKIMIADAYIGAQPGAVERVIGGPEWVQTARYDVTAKAPAEWRLSPTGPDVALLQMIRTLLEDRFKLKVHRESRPLPAYELVVLRPGTLGPKLHQSTNDCSALRTRPPQPPPGVRPQCGFSGGPGGLMVGGITMTQLAQFLQRVGRPIIDRTGLTGAYDFDLAFAPLAPPAAGAAADPSLPTIFIALEEQLGLKLQPTDGPLDVIVIDSIEQPVAD